MKQIYKIFLMFTTFALIVNSGYSQDPNSNIVGNLSFGVKLGLNYSNVYKTDGEKFNSDPKFGFAGGAFLLIPIGDVIGVQPEILFSQKGFKATGVILGSTYEIKRTTTYLDIPILFALKPSSILTLLIGPQYSHLISHKDVFSNGSSTIEQEEEFENEDYRKNTLCFLSGADVNLNHLVISARVGWDLLRNNGDGTSTTPRYKNVWYQATLGYRFY